MSRLYVYAVLGEVGGRRLGRGLTGEPLRLLRCAGLVVAAGEVDAPPPVEPDLLRAHDAVVRRLAAVADAILPARFGTLVDGRRALARDLEPAAERLREALALVAGREQMTLRVYGRPWARRRPAGPAPDAGPGTRYLAARLAARAVPELAPLRPALARLVLAERVERHRAPPLLASVYHLVPRGKGAVYAAAVEEAAKRVRGLRFAASGPWPPYSFAPEPLP